MFWQSSVGGSDFPQSQARESSEPDAVVTLFGWRKAPSANWMWIRHHCRRLSAARNSTSDLFFFRQGSLHRGFFLPSEDSEYFCTAAESNATVQSPLNERFFSRASSRPRVACCHACTAVCHRSMSERFLSRVRTQRWRISNLIRQRTVITSTRGRLTRTTRFDSACA